MTANTSPTTPGGPGIDIEQALAVIEKGQQLAGHFPSAETMARARLVLTRELTPEAARAEMHAALARIVDEERDATTQETTACRACGTWICDDCGAQRGYASRFSEQAQHCARCAGTRGHMAPVTHRANRADDHDAAYRRSLAGDVPLRYPVR